MLQVLLLLLLVFHGRVLADSAPGRSDLAGGGEGPGIGQRHTRHPVLPEMPRVAALTVVFSLVVAVGTALLHWSLSRPLPEDYYYDPSDRLGRFYDFPDDLDVRS